MLRVIFISSGGSLQLATLQELRISYRCPQSVIPRPASPHYLGAGLELSTSRQALVPLNFLKNAENVVEDSPINQLTILQVKKHTQESIIASRAIKY